MSPFLTTGGNCHRNEKFWHRENSIIACESGGNKFKQKIKPHSAEQKSWWRNKMMAAVFLRSLVPAHLISSVLLLSLSGLFILCFLSLCNKTASFPSRKINEKGSFHHLSGSFSISTSYLLMTARHIPKQPATWISPHPSKPKHVTISSNQSI